MNNILPIIIIDYFSAIQTKTCIEMYQREIRNNALAFIIVDNSNNDDNFNRLTDGKILNKCYIDGFEVYTDINIAYVKSDINLGFAKGNNLGFKVALKLYKFDYVLFSNNDIRLKQFDISILIADIQKNTNVAIVGPKVVGLDNKTQSPHKYRNIFQRWWKLLILYPFNEVIHKINNNYIIESDIICNAKRGYVYRVIGAFMLCDAAIFENINGFDENTFLYAEELILSEKLKTLGYRFYYDDRIEIVHEGGFTTKKEIPDYLKKLKKRFDSELYYYDKYMKVNESVINITKILFGFYSIKYKIITYLYDKLREYYNI